MPLKLKIIAHEIPTPILKYTLADLKLVGQI